MEVNINACIMPQRIHRWHANEARSYKEFYICSLRRRVMCRIFHSTLENARIDTRDIHIQSCCRACLISSPCVLLFPYITKSCSRWKTNARCSCPSCNVWSVSVRHWLHSILLFKYFSPVKIPGNILRPSFLFVTWHEKLWYCCLRYLLYLLF